MVTVPVQLGERSYDIYVGPGLLRDAGALIAVVLRSGQNSIPVVTDENVVRLHYPELAKSLAGVGLIPKPIVIPPGRASLNLTSSSIRFLQRMWNAAG